jgi:DNA invertase Pin-like site-specific DNA recombinase
VPLSFLALLMSFGSRFPQASTKVSFNPVDGSLQEGMMTDGKLLVPAAQYLRMSTEHQQYSLENQSTTIQGYAESHEFEVVQTYSDSAKSGVVLAHRSGLRQLLQDVVAGAARYRAILVYDVSRWGRFQDTDESAHYEFLCKSAGVPVHYCAETFANDGTLPSLIMKALKRTMAGEYSRELGVKVLAGQKHLARLGFKQGGVPGYGLRRMLVSATGTPKQELEAGERKSITTDRVILSRSRTGSASGQGHLSDAYTRKTVCLRHCSGTESQKRLIHRRFRMGLPSRLYRPHQSKIHGMSRLWSNVQ